MTQTVTPRAAIDAKLPNSPIPAPGSPDELRAFAEIQGGLATMFSRVFSDPKAPRTVVVIPSMSLDHEELAKLTGASRYEERFLCLVVSLLRSRNSRVIYVTSQPILPRLIDYYFGLVPELDTPEARSRFAVVSLVDGRNQPLTKKLLGRPGAIERIRALVAQREQSRRPAALRVRGRRAGAEENGAHDARRVSGHRRTVKLLRRGASARAVRAPGRRSARSRRAGRRRRSTSNRRPTP